MTDTPPYSPPAPAAATHAVAVPAERAGWRLDRLLAAALPDLSRTRLQALIAAGHVTPAAGGGGTDAADAARRVKAGETYVVRIPPPVAATPEAEAIPLAVLYEDDALIVIDKPAGLVVHPAAGHAGGTLVNALLAHCRGGLSGIGGVSRPGIVHRLDKDTAGLLVVAKTDRAHRALAAQFAAHTVDRAYYALAWGRPQPPQGEIAGAIGRSPANRKKMAMVQRGGKAALTRYETVRPGRVASLLRCRLATGRTHQIRVHLAALGHPVVGDPLYGGRRASGAPPAARALAAAFGGQALQAYRLGFVHPVSGERLSFEVPLAPAMQALGDALEAL